MYPTNNIRYRKLQRRIMYFLKYCKNTSTAFVTVMSRLNLTPAQYRTVGEHFVIVYDYLVKLNYYLAWGRYCYDHLNQRDHTPRETIHWLNRCCNVTQKANHVMKKSYRQIKRAVSKLVDIF